jgi:hypothetical protein
MIEFSAIRIDTNELIISNCIIQKYICEKKIVLLSENGRWYYVKPETLKFKNNFISLV